MNVHETELARLMASAQGGNAEDYARLLGQLEVLVKASLTRTFRRWGLGPDEIADVAQEVLLALHHKRGTYDPNEPFLPWFHAITHYKAVDHLRRVHGHRRRFEPLEETLHDRGAAEEPDPGASQDWEKLSEVLNEKQRTVLGLVKLEGLSVSEASRRTGYSPSDIKVTVHRALTFLKAWVQTEER